MTFTDISVIQTEESVEFAEKFAVAKSVYWDQKVSVHLEGLLENARYFSNTNILSKNEF